MTELFYSGSGERTKLAVHAALGTLALLCCSYNAIAWCLRNERHLLRNVSIYGAIACLEVGQVVHHRRAR